MYSCGIGNAGLECAANPRAGGAGWLKVGRREYENGDTSHCSTVLRTASLRPSAAAVNRWTRSRVASPSTSATCSRAGPTIASSPIFTPSACPRRKRRGRRGRATRWRSSCRPAPHHSVVPPAYGPTHPRPLSTLFVQADKHVLIESRHGAITAGDYILGRIRSNFDKKG